MNIVNTQLNNSTLENAIQKADNLINKTRRFRRRLRNTSISLVIIGLLGLAGYKGYDTYTDYKNKKNQAYISFYNQIQEEFSNKEYNSVNEKCTELINEIQKSIPFRNKELLLKTKDLQQASIDEIIKTEISRLDDLNFKFEKAKENVANEAYTKAEAELVEIMEELSTGITYGSKNLFQEVLDYKTNILDSKVNEVNNLVNFASFEFISYDKGLLSKDVSSMIKMHNRCQDLYNETKNRKFSQASDLKSRCIYYNNEFQKRIDIIASQRYNYYIKQVSMISGFIQQGNYKEAKSLNDKLNQNIHSDKEIGLFSYNNLSLRVENLRRFNEQDIIRFELRGLNGLVNRFERIKSYVPNEYYETAEDGISDILKVLSNGITSESGKFLNEVMQYKTNVLNPKIREVNELVSFANNEFSSYNNSLAGNNVYNMIIMHNRCEDLYAKIKNRGFSQASNLRSRCLYYSNQFQNRISNAAEHWFDYYIRKALELETLVNQGKYKEAKALNEKLKSEMELDIKIGLFSDKYLKR